MTTVNEHTGKFIRTRAATNEYRANYDNIDWGSKKKQKKRREKKEKENEQT